ncbi:unnamed protein product [marine sediment metagenome]|uniref:Uncharacterized protein n=1 Tax=marine sediment metagenome TaxID=412755 RepID=X1VKU2_9ZZZZ
MITTDLLTHAKKINNREIYTASGTLWIDTTHYKAVVPALKRWFFTGGTVQRDVSSTATVYIKDAADAIIFYADYQAAATTIYQYPDPTVMKAPLPRILDPGEYVEIFFGTAQSTAAYATCVVLEVDI